MPTDLVPALSDEAIRVLRSIKRYPGLTSFLLADHLGGTFEPGGDGRSSELETLGQQLLGLDLATYDQPSGKSEAVWNLTADGVALLEVLGGPWVYLRSFEAGHPTISRISNLGRRGSLLEVQDHTVLRTGRPADMPGLPLQLELTEFIIAVQAVGTVRITHRKRGYFGDLGLAESDIAEQLAELQAAPSA